MLLKIRPNSLLNDVLNFNTLHIKSNYNGISLKTQFYFLRRHLTYDYKSLTQNKLAYIIQTSVGVCFVNSVTH